MIHIFRPAIATMLRLELRSQSSMNDKREISASYLARGLGQYKTWILQSYITTEGHNDERTKQTTWWPVFHLSPIGYSEVTQPLVFTDLEFPTANDAYKAGQRAMEIFHGEVP